MVDSWGWLEGNSNRSMREKRGQDESAGDAGRSSTNDVRRLSRGSGPVEGLQLHHWCHRQHHHHHCRLRYFQHRCVWTCLFLAKRPLVSARAQVNAVSSYTSGLLSCVSTAERELPGVFPVVIGLRAINPSLPRKKILFLRTGLVVLTSAMTAFNGRASHGSGIAALQGTSVHHHPLLSHTPHTRAVRG